MDLRTHDEYVVSSSEEVSLIEAMQAKLEVPGKLILVKLQTNGLEFVGMVDTAATANFISREAVKKAGAKVDVLTWPLVCKFANDTKGVVSEVIRQFPVEVIGESENFVSKEQYYVLDGLEVDFVLSIAYVRKHNIVLRPSEGVLTIPDRKGNPIVIREILDNKAYKVEANNVSVLTSCISAKQWRKDVKAGFECYFFHLHPSEVPEQPKLKGFKVGPNCGRVPEILEEFSDMLPNKLPKGLPPRREVDHHIELQPGSAPQAKSSYRLNLNEQNLLKDSLKELLEQGFIQPSKSPYGAPAIFAAKKDGALRLCADYRALNKQTVKDRYPLPHMDDLFNSVVGATVFSKIDLRTGFHQIRMAKGDEPKTAISTRFGAFEYLVMPFGLCNATATFMKMMNDIFHDLLDNGIVVFIDDILIYSRTLEEHEQLLKEVFRRLRKHHLYAKAAKCEFA
ncbi:MAG TPA: reverse transcriptase family protein, partial [Candidatus Saccharimonadales bacterium]